MVGLITQHKSNSSTTIVITPTSRNWQKLGWYITNIIWIGYPEQQTIQMQGGEQTKLKALPWIGTIQIG